MIIQDYDSKTFIDRRREFLDWLLRHSDYKVEYYPIQNKKSRVISGMFREMPGRKGYWANYGSNLNILELQEDEEIVTRSMETVYDGLNFKSEWNTRFVNRHELIIEFDRLDFKKSLQVIYAVCDKLIDLKIHFALFGCLVETCPHIRIYDFLPDGLNTKQQYIARLLFCEQVVPEEYFENLDRQLLVTGKTVCLEFAKHWRHKVMFKLIFEHVPGGKNEPT